MADIQNLLRVGAVVLTLTAVALTITNVDNMIARNICVCVPYRHIDSRITGHVTA